MVTAHGLIKRYRGVAALDGVDFAVRRGASVALTGPSGSGKTTLARCLARVEQPDAGTIGYADEALARPRVQLVCQDVGGSFNPRFTVEEIVAEPLRIAGVAKPMAAGRAGDLLRQVRVDAGSRRPHELSGGERQRVAIARALAADPRLIIFDESLSRLDLATQMQIANLLAELRERYGLTYLHITHDPELARILAFQVLAMRAGRIVPGI